MSDTAKNSSPAISDAIWVIALTAASYVIAFSYESGFAKYFNIPVSLISISPTLLLNAGGALLAAAIPMYAIANAIWPLLPRSETALAKTIRLLVKQTLFFGFVFSPLLVQGEGWYFFGGVVASIAFFELIFPLFTQRKIPTFEQKLAEQDKIERDVIPFSLTGTAVDRFGRAPVLFLLLLLVVSSFAAILGRQDAKRKTDFLLVKGEPNTALLCQYDNVFVTQSFDQESKVLTGHIKIVRLGDGKEIELAMGSVGPLISKQVKK
jgi:phage shock protein PspC (stress-responsive transcriptional regulator)